MIHPGKWQVLIKAQNTLGFRKRKQFNSFVQKSVIKENFMGEISEVGLKGIWDFYMRSHRKRGNCMIGRKPEYR